MHESTKKWQRNQRKKWIESKVCAKCGGELGTSNRIACDKCLKRHREYYKKQHNNFALEKKCRMCGGELEKNTEFVTCYDCRLAQRIRHKSKTAMKELKEQLANGEYHKRQLKKRQAMG